MAETCPKKPQGIIDLGHCDHLQSQQTFTTSGAIDTFLDRHQCCYCGRWREEKLRIGKDPNHGQYAPRVMILVRETPGDA